MKTLYILGILLLLFTVLSCSNKTKSQASTSDINNHIIASLVTEKYGEDYIVQKNEPESFALVLKESFRRPNQAHPDLDIIIIDLKKKIITGEHKANLARCKWSGNDQIELTMYPEGIPSSSDTDFGPKTYTINPQTGRKFLNRK